MKLFRTALASMCMLLLTSTLAHGQSMGGGGSTPATGGGSAAKAGTAAGSVEYDIDLPLAQPTLVTPKATNPPPPPPPPPPTQPPGNPPPTIYGKPLQSENGTIFYVIDVSGSMGWDMGQYTAPDGSTQTGDRLDRAKAALSVSVMSLPSNFTFNMLSYDCGTYPWMGGFVPANDSNKAAAQQWIGQLQPMGATGTGPAMVQALAIPNNKLVVLLTDGAPNCGAGDESGDDSCIQAHLQMIDSANSQHAVINVFGISATDVFRTFCMNVAANNGGSYTDVR